MEMSGKIDVFKGFEYVPFAVWVNGYYLYPFKRTCRILSRCNGRREPGAQEHGRVQSISHHEGHEEREEGHAFL